LADFTSKDYEAEMLVSSNLAHPVLPDCSFASRRGSDARTGYCPFVVAAKRSKLSCVLANQVRTVDLAAFLMDDVANRVIPPTDDKDALPPSVVMKLDVEGKRLKPCVAQANV
jgi:hypothetical protein